MGPRPGGDGDVKSPVLIRNRKSSVLTQLITLISFIIFYAFFPAKISSSQSQPRSRPQCCGVNKCPRPPGSPCPGPPQKAALTLLPRAANRPETRALHLVNSASGASLLCLYPEAGWEKRSAGWGWGGDGGRGAY